MRRTQRNPTQLDLFGPPGATDPLRTPQWDNLPRQMRHKITGLMARLFVEYGQERSREAEKSKPEGTGVDPLQVKEDDDV